MSAYKYSAGSKQTNRKRIKELKDFVKVLRSGEIVFKTRCFYDSKTHYFCEERSHWAPQICRYFETFDEFIEYRQGDLRDCDISNVIGMNHDFSKYKVDETTKLPIESKCGLMYTVKKSYDDIKKTFSVLQMWHNKRGGLAKHYQQTFSCFFDFVAFLKGDLSDADLLFCDGLKNLRGSTGLNLTGARLTSEVSEALGVPYDAYVINVQSIQSFVQTAENEKETALALQSDRKLALYLEEKTNNQKVYYISDMHLMHKILNANCKSNNDIVYVVSNLAKDIVNEVSSGICEKQLILIGGDTSSDFFVFELFVKKLRETMKLCNCNADVVFVLGNHELWGFPNQDFTSIVSKYNLLIGSQGMYLLQNDILYKDSNRKICRIAQRNCYPLIKLLSVKDLEVQD